MVGAPRGWFPQEVKQFNAKQHTGVGWANGRGSPGSGMGWGIHHNPNRAIQKGLSRTGISRGSWIIVESYQQSYARKRPQARMLEHQEEWLGEPKTGLGV